MPAKPAGIFFKINCAYLPLEVGACVFNWFIFGESPVKYKGVKRLTGA